MTGKREIPQKEDLGCEFKSDLKRLPDSELIDTVVALSNTDGGVLYLGVEDDGTPTGIHEAHADATGLSALVSNKTMPPVPARATMLRLAADGSPDEEGVRVMALEVPKSTAIVASRDGKILRRLIKADGSPESVPMYPYEIITRLSTIGQLDYSSLPLPDASMDDFSKEELARLRDILSRSRNNGDQALLELPDDEMLSALRMVAMVDGRKVPTVTGILLAGKREAIARCVPTSGAAFQVLEGTEVRVNQDFDQPLLYTIEKMREMLEPWNPEREYEEGLFRQPVPEFDHRAFREALVNAFGHRDYASLGRVRVLVDDEGLTISNPGGFVEGVTIDNLLTVEPHGRNECLMGALKRIGLAEENGARRRQDLRGLPLLRTPSSGLLRFDVCQRHGIHRKERPRQAVHAHDQRRARADGKASFPQVAPRFGRPEAAEETNARRPVLPNPRNRLRDAFNRRESCRGGSRRRSGERQRPRLHAQRQGVLAIRQGRRLRAPIRHRQD